MASSNTVSIGDSNNDRQPEMVAETGNINISETRRDSIEIQIWGLRPRRARKSVGK